MRSAVAGASPWQAIVSSPMRRCREFAHELSTENGIPLIIEQQFKEVGFGSWEGLTPQQIQSQNPEQYQAFYADPVNQRPPGAEPLQAFRNRVEQAFEQLLQQNQGQHVLLVSHAGVMRAIIAYVVHADSPGMYNIKINNAGLCRIRCSNNSLVLEFINAVGVRAV